MDYISKGLHTRGRNSSITATRPEMLSSLSNRKPSGVAVKISILEFLATIRFVSLEDVKWPMYLIRVNVFNEI